LIFGLSLCWAPIIHNVPVLAPGRRVGWSRHAPVLAIIPRAAVTFARRRHRIHPELLLPLYPPEFVLLFDFRWHLGLRERQRQCVGVVRTRLAALLHVGLRFQHRQVAPVDVVSGPARSAAIFSSASIAPWSKFFILSHM
jgi:hypothetical protein